MFGWQAHKVRTFYPFAQVRSWENHGEFVIIEVTKKGKGPKQKPIQIKIKADEGCVPLPSVLCPPLHFPLHFPPLTHLLSGPLPRFAIHGSGINWLRQKLNFSETF